jgi:hypothetical protein
VLRFYAQSFVAATGQFSQIAQILNRGECLRDSHVPELGGMLGELMRECQKIDLPMTLAQLNRIKEGVDNRTFFDHKTMNVQLQELMNRMWDELDSHVFYQLESSKSDYYEKPDQKLGPEISKAFPSTVFDFVEASKCYAVGRSTACVSHLMRGLEIVLACMAKKFGVSAEHTNWHNIIEQTESKIRELPNAKPPHWKEDLEFYSQAASHFMVFKDAWRNYTAHARGRYDDEDARRIMDNVFAFTRKLAAKLKE